MRGITIILGVFFLACGNGKADCPNGSIGCECTPGGYCDPPGTCEDGLCVATDASADTVGDGPVDAAGDEVPDTFVETECATDEDCDDDDPCTSDQCGTDGDCDHDPVDEDDDGYPAREVAGTLCTGGTDCDDSTSDVHPDAALDCTGAGDSDCDGMSDTDEDGDGFTTTACGGDDCDDADPASFPGSLAVDCTAIDHDCNGNEDRDNDGDGHEAEDCGGDDCRDDDEHVNPSQTEQPCNGKDDDCNGWLYDTEDADHDGYPRLTCAGPGMEVDCDDNDAAINPRATEVPRNAVDEDCDGSPDVLVPVTAGSFTMGSPDTEPGRATNEVQHLVTLTRSFEIMPTEVTQAQFEAFMGRNPSAFTTCGETCPVESVNWSEAAAYANALSTRARIALCYTCIGSGASVSCVPSDAFATPYDCPGYRLPTEAEWEYAARGGITEGTYAGTSTLTGCETTNDVLDPIAWFCGNAEDTPHPVGGKDANPLGLVDMLGNLWEWCSDWYAWYPGTVTDPFGPSTGPGRITRGGSWYGQAMFARAAFRHNQTMDTRATTLGFRLVKTLP